MCLFQWRADGHTEIADSVYHDLDRHARLDRPRSNGGTAGDEIAGVERHVL